MNNKILLLSSIELQCLIKNSIVAYWPSNVQLTQTQITDFLLVVCFAFDLLSLFIWPMVTALAALFLASGQFHFLDCFVVLVTNMNNK